MVATDRVSHHTRWAARARLAVGLLLAGCLLWRAGSPWAGRPANLWHNLGGPVLGLLFLLAYFWGWGAVLGRLLRLWPSGHARPLAIVGLGMCGAATWLFLVGMLGGFRVWVLVASSVVVVPLGLWLDPPRARPSSWKIGEWTLLLAIGLFAGYLFVDALMPLSSMAWDTVSHHLPMGKIFLRHGRILPLPWMPQSNFPLATDLLFFHGLMVGGDPLALLLNWLLYVLAAAAVYHMVRLHLSRIYALFAALVFLLTPESRSWMDSCYVEIGWTCFAALALWCLLEWRHRPQPTRWLDLAAIFAGFTVGTKLPAVIGAAAMAILVLAWTFDRSRPRLSLGPALRFAGIALLVASPTYLKAYWFSGTPVWPLTLGVFEVRDWPPGLRHQILDLFDRIAGAQRFTVGNLLLTPWRRRFQLEMLLLPSLLIAALARRRSWGVLAPCALVAATGYLVLFTVSDQARFLLPIMPAVLVGLTLATAPGAGRRLERLAFAGFWAAVLVLSIVPWLKPLHSPSALFTLVTGGESRDQLRVGDPLYDASQMVMRHTTERDRILFFGEVRGYFIDRDYTWGDPLAQPFVHYASLPSAAALARELRSRGYTHVLYYRPEWLSEIYPAPAVLLMETLLLGARQVGASGPYELLDIRDLEECAWSGTAPELLAAGIQSELTGSAAMGRLARLVDAQLVNLLPNGGFERGLDGWANAAPASLTLVQGGGLASPTALTVRGPAGALGFNFAQLSAHVPVEAGATYIAGAFLRTRDLSDPAGFGAKLEVVAFAADGKDSWRASKAITGASDWSLVTLTFRVPATVRRVIFFAPRVPRFNGGEVTMDQVFLAKISDCRSQRR